MPGLRRVVRHLRPTPWEVFMSWTRARSILEPFDSNDTSNTACLGTRDSPPKDAMSKLIVRLDTVRLLASVAVVSPSPSSAVRDSHPGPLVSAGAHQTNHAKISPQTPTKKE